MITTALTLTAAPVLKLDERFEEEEFQSSHEEEMSQLKTASEHSGLTLKVRFIIQIVSFYVQFDYWIPKRDFNSL